VIVPIVEKGVDRSRLALLSEVDWRELDLSAPTEAMANVTASLQPRPPQPDLLSALVILGLGVLLGMLITSLASKS
jgi:hypothetical protein